MNKNIIKIGVVGAESTGKSELCKALAKQYATVWVPEYAREYFNESDIYNYTKKDLVIIAKKQIEAEKELIKKANRFLFCDTTLITLKIWAELEFKQIPAFIAENLGKIKYDHYFITDNDIPWVPDELRQNKFSREMILQANVKEIKAQNCEFSIIRGINELRLQNSKLVLGEKFTF